MARAGGIRPLLTAVLAASLMALSGLTAVPAAASHDPDCNADDPANPEGSATVWSHPQCLSSSGDNGEVPQVDLADNGQAVAVWRVLDRRPGINKFRVQFSTRTRQANGGNFAVQPDPPPEPEDPDNPPPGYAEALAQYNQRLDATYLSSADQDVGVHLRMAMNRRGDAIVIWEQEGSGGRTEIHSAFKPFDGNFGAPQLVVSDGGTSLVEPEVGIDGEGRATVMYHEPAFPFAGPVGSGSVYASKTRSAGAGGAWSPGSTPVQEHQVYPGEIPADPIYNEYSGKLKVEESGTRRALLVSQKYGGSASDIDGRPGNGRPRVLASKMDPSDTEWESDGTYDEGADEPHTLQQTTFAGNDLDAFSQNNRPVRHQPRPEPRADQRAPARAIPRGPGRPLRSTSSWTRSPCGARVR